MFCHDLANLKHECMKLMTENSLSEMCHCATAKLAPDVSKKYSVFIFMGLESQSLDLDQSHSEAVSYPRKIKSSMRLP
jgi:hypothetical protein